MGKSRNQTEVKVKPMRGEAGGIVGDEALPTRERILVVAMRLFWEKG